MVLRGSGLGRGGRKCVVVVFERVGAKTTKHDPLDARSLAERGKHRLYRDRRGAVGREAESARGDRRIGNRGKSMPSGKSKRVAIAARKQRVLAALTAAPHGPDGVDHITCGKFEARRDLGLSGVAAAERLARFIEVTSGCAMDGAIDSAAAEQRPVGGVNDGLD